MFHPQKWRIVRAGSIFILCHLWFTPWIWRTCTFYFFISQDMSIIWFPYKLLIISALLSNSEPGFRNVKITRFSSWHNLQNFSPALHCNYVSLKSFPSSYLQLGVLCIFYFPYISRHSSGITMPIQPEWCCNVCCISLNMPLWLTNIIHYRKAFNLSFSFVYNVVSQTLPI